MNVYKITTEGKTEFVCGDTLIQALQTYCSLNDKEIMDFDYDDDVILFPREQWKDVTVIDPDHEMPDQTIEEFINGIKQ